MMASQFAAGRENAFGTPEWIGDRGRTDNGSGGAQTQSSFWPPSEMKSALSLVSSSGASSPAPRKRAHSPELQQSEPLNLNSSLLLQNPPSGSLDAAAHLPVASSEDFFQQTLLELAANQSAALGSEEADECGNSVQRHQQQLADMFDAQKVFQKLELAVGDAQLAASGAGGDQLRGAGQLTLASLTPFLLALQTQQLQLDLSPSSFFNAAAHSFPPPAADAQRTDSSPGPEEDDQREDSADGSLLAVEAEGAPQPEDLSLRGGGGTDVEMAAGQNSAGADGKTGHWSYEEQFKQLYELSDEPGRREWLDDWFNFMHRTGRAVTRIPIMAKQVLDLYELYRLVVQHGGLVEVINKKLWREITKGLNLPSSITSAAFTLRTQYQKYLFDYECERHNFSTKEDLNTAVEGNKREGRRPPPPGAQHHQQQSSASTPSLSHQQRALLAEQPHQQQQQMAAMMAAALSAVNTTFPHGLPLPAAPFFAAAAAGKQLSAPGGFNPFLGMAKEEEDLLAGQQQQSAATPRPTFGPPAFAHPPIPPHPQQYAPPAALRHFSRMEENSPLCKFLDSPVRPASTAESNPGSAPKRRRTANTPLLENGHDGLLEGREMQQLRPEQAGPSPATTDLLIGPEALGPIGQLLKNASHCSLKMNNGGQSMIKKVGLPSGSSNSMVVSMEMNGTLYQGVLFAIESPIALDNSTQSSHSCSPNPQKHSTTGRK